MTAPLRLGTRGSALAMAQSGQIAAMDPSGSYLCARHMEHWYCGACGIQLPEFCGPGADPLCDHCAEDINEDE